MNAEGHKKKADELGDSFDTLLPDPEGEHVVAIGELTHGAAIHLIVFGMENKYNKHPDTHVGLPRELRKLGEIDIAMIFETMGMFMSGRWYGSKGNGDVVGRCLGFIEKIKEWASE